MEAKVYLFHPETNPDVSTLVVLDFAWKLGTNFSNINRKIVSTLVVLDFAWKQIGVYWFRIKGLGFQPLLYWILLGSGFLLMGSLEPSWCFNPCCIGFCLEAGIQHKLSPHACRRFNPCCIGFCLEANIVI